MAQKQNRSHEDDFQKNKSNGIFRSHSLPPDRRARRFGARRCVTFRAHVHPRPLPATTAPCGRLSLRAEPLKTSRHTAFFQHSSQAKKPTARMHLQRAVFMCSGCRCFPPPREGRKPCPQPLPFEKTARPARKTRFPRFVFPLFLKWSISHDRQNHHF